MRFHYGSHAVLQASLYLYHPGTENAPDRTRGCDGSAYGYLDCTTITRSDALRQRPQVFDSRSGQQIWIGIFIYGGKQGHPRIEDALSSAEGECSLRTFYGQPQARVFGSYVDLAPGAFEASSQGICELHNEARPHQGIGQRRLGCFDTPALPQPVGKVSAKPILGGLHHDYSRSAYL